MSGLEKKSKKNKKSKKKVENKDEDVLERVMGSIEMAGASMNFFEESTEATEPIEAQQQAEELVEETSQSRAEGEDSGAHTEASEDEVLFETASEGVELEEDFAKVDDEFIDEETENLELLPDENLEEEFVEQSQAYSIIESLLFSTDRPVGLGTLKQVFKGTNFKTKEIKKTLEEMQSIYAEPTRGVSLEEINGGWQLRTKSDNADFLRKLGKARPFKLSGPALEVLAIVAYKQPIVKNEVDQIRGVESGHLLRALMEKHLVNFQGKSELPGKPMQYGTTRKFLEIFGLRNLRELPSLDEIDQLLPDGIDIEDKDEKLSDVTESLSESYEGNYSEGEEELLKIEDTLGEIDTSSEFFEEEKKRQKEKRDRDRAQNIREALDVGEEVDSKDQRWLARYDEKIALAQAEAEQAEAIADDESVIHSESVEEQEDTMEFSSSQSQEPEDLIPSADSIDESLSDLTTENQLEPNLAEFSDPDEVES